MYVHVCIWYPTQSADNQQKKKKFIRISAKLKNKYKCQFVQLNLKIVLQLNSS